MLKSLQALMFSIFFSVSILAAAFPVSEKQPASGLFPLSILSSEPDLVFIPEAGDFANKYLFVADGSTLSVVDLELFALSSLSFESFESTITGLATSSDGASLYVSLDNGDLLSMDLNNDSTFENTNNDDDDEDNLEDSRLLILTSEPSSASFDGMVSDPEQEYLYLFNSDSGYFYEVNTNTKALTEIQLTINSTIQSDDTESVSTIYTPTQILFSNSNFGDAIFISTEEGSLLLIEPQSLTYSEYVLSVRDNTDTSPAKFTRMALSEDHQFVFLLDGTNNLIWVFDRNSLSFLDQISDATSLDPIESDASDNTSFSDLLVFEDQNSDSYLYIAGSNGLSLADANAPDTKEAEKLFDTDENTDGTNPISLSATPSKLIKTHDGDGYVFSFNGDASISVLTDNPAVTISSIDATSLTESASQFSLTIQADTTGSYTVYANSNPARTIGTELITATSITTLNTDTTTASININSFDRDVFLEGENRILVYLEDANGNVGRHGKTITVDRPPESMTILASNYGNGSAYAQFTKLTDDDIANYTLYAEPATDQSNPSCPSTLTFSSAATITVTFSADDCPTSGTTCEAQITGLTNDTVYCLAMNATDDSNQSGTIASFSNAVTPERTVGPAEFLNESGCSLNRHAKSQNQNGILFLSLALLLLCLRFSKKFLGLFLGLALLIGPVYAEEATPENFLLEIKFVNWMPTNSQMKTFFSSYFNPSGEVEFGWLYKNRFGFTGTIGFAYKNGNAVGLTSGSSSGDTFSLMTFPLRADFLYRHDIKSNQFFVPFARVGLDSVIFYENGPSSSTFGNKWGLHAGIGAGILLDRIEDMSQNLERDMGINDIYLNIEFRYAYIQNFSSSGLSFSGFYPNLGLLFTF